MPLFSSSQPYTSITVKVDQLTSKSDDDQALEIRLSELIELIQVQKQTGAVEVARAIRKRIKYGETTGERLRALQILELLILNSGGGIAPTIASDYKLLQLLKSIGSGSAVTGDGSHYNPQVSKRVRSLAIGWKGELSGLKGYSDLANLYKSIPSLNSKNNKHSRTSSGNVFESPLDTRINDTEPREEYHEEPRQSEVREESESKGEKLKKIGEKHRKRRESKIQRRSGRRKKGVVTYADERYRIPQINYDVEAKKIREVIADSHTHTTNLSNILKTLPEDLSPLEENQATKEFEHCRKIRRKVLRYLQYVGAGDPSAKSERVQAMDDAFLGSLISANEQLVGVFSAFDKASGYDNQNSASNYDNEDLESTDSYYTESSDDENIPGPSSVAENVHEIPLISESGPNTSNPRSPPPPRPVKPDFFSMSNDSTDVTKSLSSKAEKLTAPSSDTLASDPFGDGKELV